MWHLSIYGLVVGCYLLIKLVLSVVARKGKDYGGEDPNWPPFDVACIITAYNESPEMLRKCLWSILDQTRRPAAVTVVDDCSTRPVWLSPALREEFAEKGIMLEVHRFDVNKGKREGLAYGFRVHAGADAYLCVDSDTVLDQRALEHAVLPFNDSRVNVVTGLVLAHNRAKNMLTRFIDMRYAGAMLGDRVAYSRFGSVLCACGSLALYRGDVVRRHLADFLGQTFLGQPCTFGDDRRLTYYCLLEGRSVIEPKAVAHTDVPENLRHLVKQQTRWTKSFIRESILLLRKRLWRRTFWWLSLIEVVTWVVFTTALIVVSGLVVAGHGVSPWAYLLAVSALTYLRSVHYLRPATGVPLGARLVTFALSPLFTLLNLLLLVPLRVYALCTMADGSWGTRSKVEIP